MTAPLALDLVIGALALDGFGPGPRGACADAFAAEFERLATTRGFPLPNSGGGWRLPVISIEAGPGSSDAGLGRALARGLFMALHEAARAP